jgi:hypothetical protein
MKNDVNPNAANEPSVVNPTHEKTLTGKETSERTGEGVDTVANRLAHKGAKAEKEFDNENGKLFSK